MVYIILAALHLLLSLLVGIGIWRGKLSLHKYMFFVVLLLPFWGLLIAAVLHFQLGYNADDAAALETVSMKVDSEVYRTVSVDEKRAERTVPMEEALLINSARERRTLIMDVLNDNPGDYVEFLQKAGNNDDTEVVHYAVTAMVEISKENDYMLQKLEEAYNAQPNDLDVLSQYCDFLWSCLSKNLMQGQLEIMNRELFARLIREKIDLVSTVADYGRLVENDLKRKDYEAAGEGLETMAEKWPDSERYIILKIQYFASLGKGDEIHAFIEEIKNKHIYLSGKTKEVLAFWAN